MSTFTVAGHHVGRVGYGAMQLPGPGVFGPPRDHDEPVRVLRRVVELGIDHIDTSQFYGPNVSNELIKEALHPYADDLVIVSKVGAVRGPSGEWLPAQRPDQLVAAVRENLVTLDVERLPVVNLRVMPVDEIGEENACPLEEQLGAMQGLVEAGELEAFGVSNVSTEQARVALDAGAVCVQNAYNLLMRDDDATLELCRERGVAYVPFFPLGSAFEHLPKVGDDRAVQRMAAERGVTPAQVGLAWLLARAENVLLIPGTSSIAHLEENTAARDVTLSDDDLMTLNALR